MDSDKNKLKDAGKYIPPEYTKSDKKWSKWQSKVENWRKGVIWASEVGVYLAPKFFWTCNDVLVWAYWAIRFHSDHLIFSVKMILNYLDSWFQDSRSIMTNPQIYNIIPEMLKQRYSEVECQYAKVERKELNFYNLIILKRHVEDVTKNVMLIGQKYANNFPVDSDGSKFQSNSSTNFHVSWLDSSNADAEKDLNISVKVKKEKLDWDFSELILDPSQLKDREVMEDLWKYRLIKVSKIKLTYIPDYVEIINTFMKSLHHISEFTLTSKNQNEYTDISEETFKLLWEVYKWTYEQFEIIGINLKEEDYKSLGEAFNKNRNNLTVNIKSCKMNDTCVAYYFNDILTKPRILFLQYLWLANNNIKDSGATIISVWIQYFEYLNSLDLRNNLIGDHGIRSISKSFKYMQRAVQVYLADNMISKKGARYITKNLHYLKSLINIDLNGNQLKDLGVELVVRWVVKEKRDLMITLKNNEVENIDAIKDIIEEEENKKWRITNFKIFID